LSQSTATGDLPSLRLRLLRLAITSVVFFAFPLTFFHRMGMAVIAGDLEGAFTLSASALGLLGAAYFYPYALMQIPVGVMVDTIGARRVLTVGFGVASVGALLFALAFSFEQALAGRLLIGLGSAAVFLTAQRIFINWYPPRQFALMGGLLNTAGNFGGLMAAMPLAMAATAFGWREVFLGVAASMIAVTLFGLLVLRDRPPEGWQRKGRHQTAPQPSLRETLALVVKARQAWLIAAGLLPIFGTRFAINGLWGGPFLTDVYGLDPAQVGAILMSMTLAAALGGPVVGYLSDRVVRSRKRLVVAGSLGFTLCLVPMVVATDAIPLPGLYLLMIALGLLFSIWLPAFAQTKDLYPAALATTVLSVVNFAATLGGALYQQLLGVIIGLFEKTASGYPPDAYRAAFGFCLATTAISTALMALSREKPGDSRGLS